MLSSTTYSRFKPTRVKVESLGIGLSNDTFQTLNMSDTQYMFVGEQQTTDAGSFYNMIVDNRGLAINTNLTDRATVGDQYALYVDGDAFITGTLRASNLVLMQDDKSYVINGSSGGGSGSGNSSGSSNNSFWSLSGGEAQNIYYPGKITIGNNLAGQCNQYPLNIVQVGDGTINHAQLSIQNTQLAQVRMGIIGAASNSPAVINTGPGVPIEFHVARTQTYFDCAYHQSYYDNTGFHYCNIPVQTPNYDDSTLAPHMTIDTLGNVGIHTNAAQLLPFTHRTAAQNGFISFPVSSEHMALQVDGALFASNILIQDPDSGLPTHIDDLYVRRLGVTLQANQIIPGPFAKGYYTFTSNVGICGPVLEPYSLNVTGDMNVTARLDVDTVINAPTIQCADLTVTNIASFTNNVYANADVIVKDSLRLQGGIFTEVLEGGKYSWCQIQFQPVNTGLSNINLIGQGITTPGRFGAGIGPADPVNHQVVIKKRQGNILDLELTDVSDVKLTKEALIGHQTSVDRPNDGSLIFATPPGNDPVYTIGYQSAFQNIYFFPGADLHTTTPIVNNNNPPVLGVFQDRRVGVNTYEPKAELDVEGSIYVSSNIIVHDPTTNEDVVMGLWKHIEQANPLSTDTPKETFKSMVYIRPGVEHIGVHTLADIGYGMTIAGGMKSVQGYYTGLDQEIVPWIRTGAPPDQLLTPCGTIINPNMYTNFHCGIGVTSPSANLDVKNIFPSDPTVVRIRTSDYDPRTALNFRGTLMDWTLQLNNAVPAYPRLELFSGAPADAPPASSDPLALFAVFNSNAKTYQVYVGMSVDDATAIANPNRTAALTVGGDLSVMGSIDVSGQYHMQGQVMINNNMNDNPVVLEETDVFIGGNNLYLQPDPLTGAVLVGYTTALRVSEGERYETAMFRVYQNNTLDPTKSLARFITESSTGLIDLVCRGNNQTLRFGAYNGTLAFLDGNYNTYLTFANSPDGTNNWLGINTSQPTAQLHIASSGSGSNMLRLTKNTSADSPFVGAELELEKLLTDDPQPIRWTVHGPDSAYGQKLALLYTDSNCNREEMFCFTSNGCVGIGTPTPEYAIDLCAGGKMAGIQIHSVADAAGGAPSPQLIFLSGSNAFGTDTLADYRFYAYEGEFSLEAEALNNVTKLFFAGSNQCVGINTTAVYDGSFALSVGGNLNVTDSIYLAGNPIFSTSGAFGNVNLQGYNLYLTPKVSLGGGIVVNSSTASPGDLFHLYSGNTANMMTFDSAYPDLQIDFRTAGSNVYRLGMSNQLYYLEYNSNVMDAAIPESHDGFTNALTVLALDTYPLYPAQEFAVAVTGSLAVQSGGDANVYLNSSTIADVARNLVLTAGSGLIGIGTTAPVAGLHVATTFAATGTPAGSNAAGLFVDPDGYVGIGTTTTIDGYGLSIGTSMVLDGPGHFTSNIYFAANTETYGNSVVHGNTITDSDVRLKTNLNRMENCLERVCSMSGYTYNMVADPDGARIMGLLAQEVQPLFPEAVTETNGRLGVAYGNLVAALVQAINELNAKVDSLSKQLTI